MRFTLATKILTPFIVMVVFSLVATNLFWYFSYRQNLREEIFEKQENLAGETIQYLERVVNEKLRFLIIYSELSDLLIFTEFGDRKEEVLTQLHRLSLQDKDLEEISILNRKGREIINFDTADLAPKEELADRSKEAEFIVPTYRMPKEYKSELYFSAEGKPKITLAIPLTFPETPREFERITKTEQRFITIAGAKPGEVLGVLTVEVNLGRIFQEMSEKKIGEEGYIYFIDKDHKIFAHPDESLAIKRVEVTEEVPHSEVSSIVTTQGKNEKGVESLMSHAHFSSLGWGGLVIQEPIKQAFSSILEIQKTAMPFALLGIILSSFISLFISNRLVGPIKKLRLITEEIEKGNFSIRADVKTKDEIEEFANAFNNMLNRIQATSTALEEAKTVLEIRVEARTRELKGLAESLDVKVKEKTIELREKITDLERFQKLAVGRELKMIELKKELKALQDGIK